MTAKIYGSTVLQPFQRYGRLHENFIVLSGHVTTSHVNLRGFNSSDG